MPEAHRPDLHTFTQREREAKRREREALRAGAALVREFNGSTRRDILEVYLSEVRRTAPMML